MATNNDVITIGVLFVSSVSLILYIAFSLSSASYIFIAVSGMRPSFAIGTECPEGLLTFILIATFLLINFVSVSSLISLEAIVLLNFQCPQLGLRLFENFQRFDVFEVFSLVSTVDHQCKR